MKRFPDALDGVLYQLVRPQWEPRTRGVDNSPTAVRPLADHSGRLGDFNGIVSAHGIILNWVGVTTLFSAPYVKNGVLVQDSVLDDAYNLSVWDISNNVLQTPLQYPDRELEWAFVGPFALPPSPSWHIQDPPPYSVVDAAFRKVCLGSQQTNGNGLRSRGAT